MGERQWRILSLPERLGSAGLVHGKPRSKSEAQDVAGCSRASADAAPRQVRRLQRPALHGEAGGDRRARANAGDSPTHIAQCRATGEVLPGAHFTEEESTVGYLRVLRDILTEKGTPHTVYGDRRSSLKRERQALDARGRASWQARTNAGRSSPRQPGRRDALRALGSCEGQSGASVGRAARPTYL